MVLVLHNYEGLPLFLLLAILLTSPVEPCALMSSLPEDFCILVYLLSPGDVIFEVKPYCIISGDYCLKRSCDEFDILSVGSASLILAKGSAFKNDFFLQIRSLSFICMRDWR
uniref:Secreted protein n=1 Tax=Rhipicephalus appendiculatus TaxID=34631 RepID=A0A131Y9J5_RHIAP